MYSFMCSRGQIHFFRQSNAVIHLFQCVRWLIYQVRNVTTSSCMVSTLQITCTSTHTLELLIVWGRMFIVRCCMKKMRDPSTCRTDSRDVSDFGLEGARFDSGMHTHIRTYMHTLCYAFYRSKI